MRLNKILIIGFLVTSILPALIVGELSYKTSERALYDLSKQDLDERTEFADNICKFYVEKVNKNEMGKAQAIEEIATILIGPKEDGGERETG